MRTLNVLAAFALPLAAALIAGAYPGQARSGTERVEGPALALGNGSARAYVEVAADGTPQAIGVALSETALEGLPAERNRTSRCFDLDGNGKINDQGECEGDTEVRLLVPADLPKGSQVPFRWVMLNWNPQGHPPEPWQLPQFDLHFYMVDQAAVDAIRTGSCGIFINCDDFARATKPVPAKYVHPEHVSVKGAVAAMGDHLIDSKTPELAKSSPTKFTHTWIFGAYDGHIIFYEPMFTRAFLLSRPDSCKPIKQPAAWERAGYYPTEYCFRFKAGSGYTVSLEGLVKREGG